MSTENGVDVTVSTPTQEEIDALNIATATLTGDLRDMALSWIRNLKKPWPACSEEEQQDVIDSLEKQAIVVAQKAVELIAAHRPGSIALHLKTFSVESSTLKVQMKGIATDENVAALLKLRGLNTIVRAADVEPFHGEKSHPTADPQQTSIPGTEDQPQRADAAE